LEKAQKKELKDFIKYLKNIAEYELRQKIYFLILLTMIKLKKK
jgi:hypothetical protein